MPPIRRSQARSRALRTLLAVAAAACCSLVGVSSALASYTINTMYALGSYKNGKGETSYTVCTFSAAQTTTPQSGSDYIDLKSAIDCTSANVGIVGRSELYDNNGGSIFNLSPYRPVLTIGSNFSPTVSPASRSYATYREYSPLRVKYYQATASFDLSGSTGGGWQSLDPRFCTGNYTPRMTCAVSVTFPSEVENVQDNRSQTLVQVEAIRRAAVALGGDVQVQVLEALAMAQQTVAAFEATLQNTQANVSEVTGDAVMGAFSSATTPADALEQSTTGTVADGTSPAAATIDQVDASTQAVQGTTDAPLDSGTSAAGEATGPADDGTAEWRDETATASATRDFYDQAAAWGRTYWSRPYATDRLAAQHRPLSQAGGDSEGVDCTNFVSNAWHLGGRVTMDSQRYSTVSNTKHWFTKLEGGFVRRSVAWVRVTTFFDYWVAKRNDALARRVSPRDRNPAISIGDVIQIDEGGGRGYSHAYLVESTRGVDKIVAWSKDYQPGTQWNDFFYKRTLPAERAKVRTRLIHYTG